jgi:carboxypeptidase C (cathepsin A)
MIRKLILLALITFAFTAPADEEVVGLFGDQYKGKIYSGMLDTEDAARRLHYVFALSQNDPVNSPVVLWLNGGPGCSSLLGFIQEHGPVIIPDYTSNLEVNKYSWNQYANMIYLESPAGVGFSTNTNKDDIKWDDQKSGKDNRKAILNFFVKFPEFKKNDFYISGESYAGVYVPMLAFLLLNDDINLKGIIVGNGLTDLKVDVEKALIDFAYDHALYSVETRKELEIHCPKESALAVTPECNAARSKIRDALGGLNIYDIYRQCPKKPASASEHSRFSVYLNTLKRINKKHTPLEFLASKFLTGRYGDEEPEGIWPEGCKDDPYPLEFFNLADTKTKLHVDPNIKYVECNHTINENYTFGDSFDIYKTHLIPPKKLRIWFYAGDTDAAVPFNGSIKWIPNLGLKITEDYRPWIVNEQTAGFVQEYEGFTFITIKGTGHMAPQWKRQESFVMFNAFLKGEKLPK